MFGVDFNEFLIVGLVALIVIGPKDLPRVLRVVGQWVGKARRIAGQFRASFDDMIRETELAEMEKKWQEENARIMAEHPPRIETVPVEAVPDAPDVAADPKPAA